MMGGGGGTVGRPSFSLSSSLTPKSSPSSSSSSSSSSSTLFSVPTRIEAQNAIAAFQSFMQGISSSRSTLDWIQPLLSHYDPKIQQSPGFQRVYDAFLLLQTVPSIQRMVVSISSDRAVWDAVLNNNKVQEFQRSLKHGIYATQNMLSMNKTPTKAEVSRPKGSINEPDLMSMILRWILDNMKLKIAELIEILKSLVNKSIESPRNEDTNNKVGSKQQFEEMICSTVLLSTITIMIVLVTRAYGP